ncbi:MAG: PAS domain S-box protein [Cyclobacteriaceae bacterium]|nr:MAG: PAS domain S-box protein [Cyclobacteriaceae bacterium]
MLAKFNDLDITSKITILVLIISLAAVSAISFFSFDINRQATRDKYQYSLQAIADAKATHINQFFETTARAITSVQTGLDSLNSGAEYLIRQQQIFGFDFIHLTNLNGAILESSDTTLESRTFLDPDGSSFAAGHLGVHFSPVFKENGKYFLFVLAPAKTTSGDGLIVAKQSLDNLYKSLTDYRGLGKTGEVLIGKLDEVNKKILLVSPVRPEPQAAIKLYNTTDKAVDAFRSALEGTAEGSGTGIDYQNKEVIQVWRKLNQPGWALVTKMDADEASGDAGSLLQIFITVGICIVLVAIAASILYARSLLRPINTMRHALELISQGVLPETIDNIHLDEFGKMASKINDLTKSLRRNADFAQKIGEGKYNTEFTPASDNDLLGMSLLNMRQNLIDNERRDTERNWIVRGVAEISEMLRLHDSIDSLSDDVVKFILDKIGAVQGAFYVVDDEGREPIIEMRASYAYGRKKYLKTKFKFAEGLVGQAAVEKDIVLRTEIPHEYVTLTSGILGDQRPTCILVVPLITNEEVYGVLEYAALKRFDPSQIKFVQELSLILARTIFNIKVNERTRKLLEESQAMSAELQEKQEVLRQNAEEMQATQEELERTNTELEHQVEEVNRTQKRMQLLLENASEVITIYEEDETIRYISPSVESILGYGQKELIGKSDFDKVHPDYKDVYISLFARMKENPDEKVTVQFEYKTKDNQYIWIEATGTNFMSNTAIHGYILNARDITERRRAEQEQRMRSKMQALSENSPDLITRLEDESISYINPVIESYTGKGPNDYLNKKYKEAGLDASILESWLRIVEQVNATNETVATEMDFPSELGKRVMQVNAIPEFDESNKLESVLVVSHDITERKMIELEIQNKNKKITESINYAKRIQTAILPNSRVISKTLPDSFILYKPRDVVSGDFPWFMQIKNDIYIAAVDCTGHGVPGALLSLIGYFLLNDIVRSRKVTDPGVILDLLDEGVTKTLRQDEDASTKDGMDIALCKVNMDTREVEYAGAHRPLYIMRNGVMEEVKGNKFPIGGGIFKNQTNFTNTKLTLKKGDSIYFSSDGYPDQFGGPEGRKFGPKRVREIIERVHKMPMLEASGIFDQEWESWRGDTKQTDDVLLIGIKF